LRRIGTHGMPQAVEDLVALPPIAMVVEIDAVEVPLAVPPFLRLEQGRCRFRLAVRMPLRVSPRVGRSAGNEPVGREGTVRIARQRHRATIAQLGLTTESRTSKMTLTLRQVMRGWEGGCNGAR